MPRPGRLNLSVEIWRDTGATVDTYGAHEEAWTLLGTRRAQIQGQRGVDRFSDENERPESTTRITLRYDTLTRTLTTRDRLRYVQDAVSIEYDIRDVFDREGEHRWIEVNAYVRSPDVARLP